MEKYKRFADNFTGINPFLPVYLNKSKNMVVQIQRWVKN